jgi:protein TonB
VRIDIPTVTNNTPVATDDGPAAPITAAVPVDIITPPVRVRLVDPEYPARARAALLEGDVLLEAVVETDGNVRGVKVLRSVHPLLDEAAKRAVEQYQYTPGQRNGVPEAVTIQLTVSFRMR